MGRCDFVVIAEAPNDEVVAGLALAVAGLGNIRTETLRAFTEAEFGSGIPGDSYLRQTRRHAAKRLARMPCR